MIPPKKLREAMRYVAERKGDFLLFALFTRAEPPGAVDLVVSAPWLEEGKLKALGDFVRLLSEVLGEEGVKEFSRIVTLNQDDPAFQAIVSAFAVDEGELRIQRSSVNGLEIEDALIIRARRAA